MGYWLPSHAEGAQYCTSYTSMEERTSSSQIWCGMLLRRCPCRNHQHQHRTRAMRKQKVPCCASSQAAMSCAASSCTSGDSMNFQFDVLVLVILLFLSWRRSEASPWRVWCPCTAQISLGNCEEKKMHTWVMVVAVRALLA